MMRKDESLDTHDYERSPKNRGLSIYQMGSSPISGDQMRSLLDDWSGPLITTTG